MTPQVPEYNLSVSFDMGGSTVTGIASMNVQAGHEVVFETGGLDILDVSLDGKRLAVGSTDGRLRINSPSGGGLEIRYRGTFRDKQEEGNINYGVTSDLIDKRGVALTGLWYPRMEGLLRYRLRAELPEGYEAVSEAERIEKERKGDLTEFTFEFAHPVEGITFASNRYEVVKETHKGIAIEAYFFSEDRGLARKYIEYAGKYLDLYEKLLDRYPYKRFSVVENFLPTGYSMPTYTLLGQDVVRLPFIVETSLGHEILHQWFGNSVYTDYDHGNWAEGLTTYLADHYYEEQKGKGWEYRKETLINYESYVNEKNEFPLRAFRSRLDFPSRAIGYGKAAMVFHMLNKLVGDDVFYKSLKSFVEKKRFQRASWEDMEKEFTRISKRDLSWFFKQWLDGKGLPLITLDNLKLRLNGGKSEVSFDAHQKRGVYTMSVPVIFYYPDGSRTSASFWIDKENNSTTIILDDVPEYMVVDEDYDLFRGLADNEYTPVIARLIGGEGILIALPPSGKEIYGEVIDYFKGKGAVEKDSSGKWDPDIKKSTIIILGKYNPLTARLFGSLTIPDSGFSITVKSNPWNPGKIVGIINAASAEEVSAAFRKILHYGKYSSLSFDKGKNVSKTMDKSRRGIRMELNKRADAVDISTVRTMSDVIKGASGKRIVYVGETHDVFAHHNVQLQVIKALFRENRMIAIGMEMFQRPFQNVIDEYMAGAIDERQFLKRTEYFKRWGFDYNFYKPIVDFAKAEKIPLIALNIRNEIVDKVSKDGLGSLTAEERKEIPAELDFSDGNYKERLRDVFEKHRNSKDRNFDYFFESQVLWDETMSQTLNEFLDKTPAFREKGQIVVVAGGGHLAYGSGIPKRTFRRNGLDYSIILNDDDIEKDIADYVVMPKPLEGVTAPKLMAMLKEEKGRLRFEGFAEGSAAEKAGIKTGDTIVSMDGTEVSDLSDVKINLFYKKKGDTVRIRVLRKRFLLGDKLLDFDVTL